jgi:hypothetical protein
MTVTKPNYYRLVRPCPKCPFRTDTEPYIRAGRAQEIASGLLGGGTFTCHQTTVVDPYDEEESSMTDGPNAAFCAGALIALEKGHTPNQMMRIGESLGGYDPKALDMDAPVDNLVVWVQRHIDAERGEDDDYEHCSIAGPSCEDPLGWGVGGGAVLNSEPGECGPDDECGRCGERMCSACRSEEDETICVNCAEDIEEGGDPDYV